MHFEQETHNKESRIETASRNINRLANTMDGHCFISHTKKNAGLVFGQRFLQESDKLWAQNVAERYKKLINANPLKSSLTRSWSKGTYINRHCYSETLDHCSALCLCVPSNSWNCYILQRPFRNDLSRLIMWFSRVVRYLSVNLLLLTKSSWQFGSMSAWDAKSYCCECRRRPLGMRSSRENAYIEKAIADSS